MVREWTQQAARATGVSLLAPIVLLVSAAVLASGGGLGGLGALGQAAAGPGLPDLGVQATEASAGAESLADADIVGADTSEPPAAATPTGTAGSGPLASGPGGAGNEGTPGSGSDPVNVSPLPPAAAPPQQAAPTPQTPSAPAPGGGGAAPADPVGDVIENTRGTVESLPGPLGPTTGDILDLLLPPRSP